MFYYPVTLLFQSLFGLVAGFLFAKVGVHWSNVIGTSIYILSTFILYISKRFFLDMISSAISGITVSILAFPVIINAFKYFMGYVWLINGIVATSSSFGTTFFTFIGEQMINPNKVQSVP